MNCREFQLASDDGTAPAETLGPQAAAHLARCPRCQARQASQAQLRAALRRAFADESAPATLVTTVRQRLAEEREAPAARPAARRRQWLIAFGAAAALAASVAIAAALIVHFRNGRPIPPSNVALANDLTRVHLACIRHSPAEHAAAGIDAAEPVTRQAQQVAARLHIADAAAPAAVEGFILASCADCKILDHKTVHLIYEQEAAEAEAGKSQVSVFILPGEQRLTGGQAAIELSRSADLNLAGFRRAGASYFLVGSAKPARLVRMATELMAGPAAGSAALASAR